MQKTLSLNRRVHLFVKDDKFFIKLQKPNTHKPVANDFYILKRLPLSDLIKIREWADQAIQGAAEANTLKTKRITFKPNTAGITHIDVNTKNWIIVGTCVELATLRNRAFKFSKRGQRVEYRDGSHYVEINADIECVN